MKKASIFVMMAMLVASYSFGQSSVMDFYKARAKDLANPDQPGGGIKSTIIKNDIKNGFVSVTHNPPLGFLLGSKESREDMAYFVAKNGQKFVAISSLIHTPIEMGGWRSDLPSFYELENGILVNKTEKYLPYSTIVALNKDLSKEEGKSMYAKIPQIGTTIQIGSIDPKKGESSFQLMYEMIFNVNDRTFKVVKK